MDFSHKDKLPSRFHAAKYNYDNLKKKKIPYLQEMKTTNSLSQSSNLKARLDKETAGCL